MKERIRDDRALYSFLRRILGILPKALIRTQAPNTVRVDLFNVETPGPLHFRARSEAIYSHPFGDLSTFIDRKPREGTKRKPADTEQNRVAKKEHPDVKHFFSTWNRTSRKEFFA